ncbi:MAG TPA: PQQ-binding-like beta-propeller repeat protein [Terriglobia bacterium]|nr:PQQ-binding-like beta-propeller repeat protein [Terriglobia bacterium]
MANSSLVFLGVKGTVIALDKSNGSEVWRARLAGSDFVNLVVEDGSVYATTRGQVFCLSATSGEIRWNNPLKGMGLGLVTIASAAGQDALAEKVRRDQAAVVAATAAATAS